MTTTARLTTMTALTLALGLPAAAQNEPSAEDLAAMMKKAQRYTQPGESHLLLKRFVGNWDVETRITMGGTKTDPETGTGTISWLIEGRWLKLETSGTMMGMPLQTFGLLGYDNFKMSYVAVQVSSMDTAMFTTEGDLDPGGDALLMYGTVDEYLTGEHDKMVKNVWRFLSDDRLVLEVHDLPIGETGTQVVEVTFKRKK